MKIVVKSCQNNVQQLFNLSNCDDRYLLRVMITQSEEVQDYINKGLERLNITSEDKQVFWFVKNGLETEACEDYYNSIINRVETKIDGYDYKVYNCNDNK